MKRVLLMTDKAEHLLMRHTARCDVINSQHQVTDLDPATLGRAATSHLRQYGIIGHRCMILTARR